jgi:hypothetical protein
MDLLFVWLLDISTTWKASQHEQKKGNMLLRALLGFPSFTTCAISPFREARDGWVVMKRFVISIVCIPSFALAVVGMGACFGPPPETSEQNSTNQPGAGSGGQVAENGSGGTGNSGTAGSATEMSGAGGSAQGMGGLSGSGGNTNLSGNSGASGVGGAGGESGASGASGVGGASGAGGMTASCPSTIVPVGVSCEAAYMNNSASCCVEGRSCQGGDCVNGQCQLATMASEVVAGETVVESLGVAQSGNYVLWGGGWGGQLFRVAKNGSSPPEVLAKPGTNSHMVADQNNLYFLSFASGNIQTVSVESGGYYSIALVPDAEAAQGRITSYQEWVYAVMRAGTHPGVYRARKDGTTPAGEVVVQDNEGIGVVVDGNYVYGNDISTGDIWKVALLPNGGLGTKEIFAAGVSSRSDIAQDETTIYWVADPDNTSMQYSIRYRRKDGTLPAMAIGTAPGTVHSLLVDDHFVYWTSLQGGIYRAKKQGGGIQTLSEPDAQKHVYWYMDQDCDTIYFSGVTDNKEGLFKIAKLTP